MKRTRVKICGVMRVEDAAMAVEAGADAIGMIFHPPARRNISLALARQIVEAAGAFVTPVGVFVDAGVERVAEVAREVGLGVVQLHGQEGADQVLELRRRGLRVIKAVRVDAALAGELEGWRRAGRGALAGVVLETAGTAGGSGLANDWALVRRFQDSGAFADLGPIIAAGGLAPETAGEVVRVIRPWAVDVSSGVESKLGEKSGQKIEAFMRAVREEDCGLGQRQ